MRHPRNFALGLGLLALAGGAAAQETPGASDFLSIDGEPSKGSSAAKVVLVEFSDYQCPYCASYARETLPQVMAGFVDTGKVRYVFRDYPLPNHTHAAKAAEAAHCAGAQGRFWEMHDTLFANSTALGPDQLASYGKTLGLNETAFAECLSSGRFAADIRKDISDAGVAGVRGTPAFFVGLAQPDGRVKIVRRLYGARPFADYRAVLESALQPAP